jgi:hypothetical protein
MRMWMYPEWITSESIDVTVNPNAKGFQDLMIQPVSFGHKAHELVNDVYWAYNSNETTKREKLND